MRFADRRPILQDSAVPAVAGPIPDDEWPDDVRFWPTIPDVAEGPPRPARRSFLGALLGVALAATLGAGQFASASVVPPAKRPPSRTSARAGQSRRVEAPGEGDGPPVARPAIADTIALVGDRVAAVQSGVIPVADLARVLPDWQAEGWVVWPIDARLCLCHRVTSMSAADFVRGVDRGERGPGGDPFAPMYTRWSRETPIDGRSETHPRPEFDSLVAARGEAPQPARKAPLRKAHRRYLKACAESRRASSLGGSIRPGDERHGPAMESQGVAMVAEREARDRLLGRIAAAAGFDLGRTPTEAQLTAKPVVASVREGRHLFMVAVSTDIDVSEVRPYRAVVAEEVF